jgi:hypothetical protein
LLCALHDPVPGIPVRSATRALSTLYERGSSGIGADFFQNHEIRSVSARTTLIEANSLQEEGGHMLNKTGRWVTTVGLFCLASPHVPAEIPGPTERVEIRITAPTMVAALLQFSQQTGLQLVFPTDGAGDIAAPAVEGNLTPRAALEQLLQNSGLTFQFVNARTVSVSLAKAHSAQGRVSPTVASPR